MHQNSNEKEVESEWRWIIRLSFHLPATESWLERVGRKLDTQKAWSEWKMEIKNRISVSAFTPLIINRASCV